MKREYIKEKESERQEHGRKMGEFIYADLQTFKAPDDSWELAKSVYRTAASSAPYCETSLKANQTSFVLVHAFMHN